MVSSGYRQKGDGELKFNFYDIMGVIDDDWCIS